MAAEKKRSTNWTSTENEVLMSQYEQHRETIEAKFGRPGMAGCITQKEKDALWETIALAVSSVGVCIRSAAEAKKKFHNIKKDAKSKIDNRKKTGGGPPAPPMTGAEEIFLRASEGAPNIEGILGGVDTFNGFEVIKDISDFSEIQPNSSLVGFVDSDIVQRSLEQSGMVEVMVSGPSFTQCTPDNQNNLQAVSDVVTTQVSQSKRGRKRGVSREELDSLNADVLKLEKEFHIENLKKVKLEQDVLTLKREILTRKLLKLQSEE